MKQVTCTIYPVLLLLLVAAGIPVVAATEVPFTIDKHSGPNYGEITLTLTIITPGYTFDDGSTVILSSCTTGDVIRGTVTYVTDTTMTARFTFKGEKPSKYNVMAWCTYTAMGTDYPSEYGISKAFETYQSEDTSTPTPTGTTSPGATTTTTTSSTSHYGENSIFFETNPPGATIYVDGDEVGTSTYTYYTDEEGTFNVLIKKDGYEDYTGTVAVTEGRRSPFYCLLTPRSSTSDTAVTTAPSSTYSSSLPGVTPTITRKSTLRVPTPLGTFAPPAEEAPVDPAITLLAAGIGMILAVIWRR